MRCLVLGIVAVLLSILAFLPNASAVATATPQFPNESFQRVENAQDLGQWLVEALRIEPRDIVATSWENQSIRAEGSAGNFAANSTLYIYATENEIRLHYDQFGNLRKIEALESLPFLATDSSHDGLRNVAFEIATRLGIDLSGAQVSYSEGGNRALVTSTRSFPWGRPYDSNSFLIRVDLPLLAVDIIEILPWFEVRGDPTVPQTTAEQTALAAARQRPGFEDARLLGSEAGVVNATTPVRAILIAQGDLGGEVSHYLIDAETGQYLGRVGEMFIDGVRPGFLGVPLIAWFIALPAIGVAACLFVYRRRRLRRLVRH